MAECGSDIASGRLLTIKEVAGLLGVSVTTVKVYVREGRFPSPIRFGRTIRWRRGAIERWIDLHSPDGYGVCESEEGGRCA